MTHSDVIVKDLISIIEPMIPALRRYARALVRDAVLADDLVQDTLERIVSRWSQRREEGEIRPWVFSILHNMAVDAIRQQSRRGLHLAIDDVDEHEMSVRGEQEGHIVHGELLRALETLSPDLRGVILLVCVEDMSYAEAAEALGVPIGTVMSRLSRGRERLQRALDGELGARTPAKGPAILRRMK